MRAPGFLLRIVLLTVALAIFPARAALQVVTQPHAGAVVSRSADGASGSPSISADGRFVLFTSGANNLLEKHSTGLAISLYVYDRVTQTTVLANGPARGDASGGLLSADGRFVTFMSAATNVIPNDRPAYMKIFQKDLQSGTLAVITDNPFTPAVDNVRGHSTLKGATPDGRYVLFDSAATEFVGLALDGNNVEDVFIRDTVEKKTRLVSHRPVPPGATSGGTAAGSASTALAISTNGNFVLYYSLATNLNMPSFNVITQRLWLYDVSLQTNVLISHGATNGNRESAFAASMTPDATVVAFAANGRLESMSSPANHSNVFVRIMATDELKAMPLPIQLKTNLATVKTFLSPDGSRVAVTATPRVVNTSTNRLLIWDVPSNAVQEIDLAVYGIHDGAALHVRFVDRTKLLLTGVANSASETVEPGGLLNIRGIAGTYLDATADGEVIALSTTDVLDLGDFNKDSDVYLLGPAGGVGLVSKAHPGSERSLPDMSIHHLQANDSVTDKIAFVSFSNALVANDTNGFADIFTWSKSTGAVKLESTGLDGAAANAHSIDPVLSADGRWLAFISFASNLVANDTNKIDDVFLKSLETGTIVRVSEPIRPPARTSFWGVRNPVISATGRYVAYATIRSEMTTNTLPSAFSTVVFDRTTGENFWAAAGLTPGTVQQRPIAIYEPNLYFFHWTNVYVMNLTTHERTLIGSASNDPAFTSDGSLAALHVATSSEPYIYTFDPATFATNFLTSFSLGQLRADRMSLSENRIVSFESNSSLLPNDTDGTNDVYTMSATNPAALQLATKSYAFPFGATNFIPRAHKLTRDGARVFYLMTTNSPVDLLPRTDLVVTDIATSTTAIVTDGPDAEPASHSTARPVFLAGGVVTATTMRDLDTPFDKANLVFSADVGDSDNDRLPDLWEQVFIGSLAESPSGDADRDGMTNADEMAIGSHPGSAESVLSLRIVETESSIEVWVRNVTDKPLQVQSTEDIASGVWTGQIMTPVRLGDSLLYRFDKTLTTTFFRVVALP
jgi:Tol biopolymer transport system component